MTFNSQRFILCLLLTLTLGACSEKGKPVIQHEAERRATETSTVTEVNTASEANTEIPQDLEQLAARVLSSARIFDPRSLHTRQVREELIALNNILLQRSNELDPNQLKRIYEKYVAALGYQCRGIRSSCVGLNYFRQAFNTSHVVKALALREEFQTKKVQLLLIAVDLKNQRPDLELLKLVLIHVPPQNPAVRSFLETDLQLIANQTEAAGKTYEFLQAIHAWKLLDPRQSLLGTSSISALWTMIARSRFIYAPGGSLHPEFQNAIRTFNSQPESLAYQQQQILAARTLKLDAMGVRPITNFDELYYILDLIFLQKISTQNAAELLQGTRRTSQDFAAAVENYVRMRFVLSLRDSTLVAKDIFTAQVSSERLFKYVEAQSQETKKIWSQLYSRLTDLQNLAVMLMKSKADGPSSEAQLRAFFNSFQRSVNLVSVAPHTLVLFHILSLKRINIFIRGWGNVDSADLMTLLFHGSVPSILSYTEGSKALNHFEVIQAFDMAIRSQLFPMVNIDTDFFIADTLNRLSETPIRAVEMNLNLIAQRFGESRHIPEVKNICTEIETGRLSPRVLDLEDFRKSPLFGQAVDMLYVPVSANNTVTTLEKGELAKVDLGLFYPDNEFAETLEKVRLEIQMHERLGQTMLASYTKYLKNFDGKTDAEIADKTKRTRAILAKMKALKERSVRMAKTWYQDLGDCYFKIAALDYDSFHLVLKAEEQYLASVHSDMTRLRQLGLGDSERQAIHERHKLNGLPSNFRGHSKLENDVYLWSSIDFMIRGIRSVEKAHPHIKFNLGTKLDLDNQRVRDSLIRPLQYTASKEAFIASGLQAVFSSSAKSVPWLSLAGARILNWEHHLKAMVSSYRLERDLYGKAEVFTPETIMAAHEEMLRLTQFTPEDQRLFQTLRLQRRYDEIFFGEILAQFSLDTSGRYGMRSVFSLFDFPVSLIQREKLGYNFDIDASTSPIPETHTPKRFGHMELGRVYYDSRSSWIRGYPIIPYNSQLDRDLDAQVTDTIRGEMESTQEFHSAATQYLANIDQRPALHRPYADINTHIRITDMLNENLMPNYNTVVNEFNRATQNCFIAKCADFN